MADVAKIPSRDGFCRLSFSLFTFTSFFIKDFYRYLIPSSVCVGFLLYLRSYRLHDKPVVLRVDLDRITFANGAIENATGDTVFNFPLDDTLEGTSTKLRIIAH